MPAVATQQMEGQLYEPEQSGPEAKPIYNSPPGGAEAVSAFGQRLQKCVWRLQAVNTAMENISTTFASLSESTQVASSYLS